MRPAVGQVRLQIMATSALPRSCQGFRAVASANICAGWDGNRCMKTQLSTYSRYVQCGINSGPLIAMVEKVLPLRTMVRAMVHSDRLQSAMVFFCSGVGKEEGPYARPMRRKHLEPCVTSYGLRFVWHALYIWHVVAMKGGATFPLRCVCLAGQLQKGSRNTTLSYPLPRLMWSVGKFGCCQ